MQPVLRFAHLACAAILLLATAGGALAQAYPNKPIRLIVPFPAGGTTDVLARTLGQKLTEAWGQPVVVENKGGAGGTLGAAEAARAPADGYTLLMAAVHHTIATSVYPKLTYNFQQDFAPVTVFAIVPNVLVVHPSIPANSVKELIAHAKANPGQLTYGSAGTGSAHHVIGEQFNLMAGTKIVHVPYKGSAPAITDLAGGQISMMYDTISSAIGYIKAGKIRPLGVATGKRSSALPDVPTIAEAALPGFDIASWFGVVVPAKTPKEIITKLNAELVKILAMPDVKKRLADIGAEPAGGAPGEMAARIKKETEEFAKIVKEAKVIVE